MTTPFKAGNFVQCINSVNSGEQLRQGLTYRVDSADSRYVYLSDFPDAGWNPSRFRHAPTEDTKLAPKVSGSRTIYGLPTDSQARKEIPVYSGFIRYFPLAIARVAQLSLENNRKHNPTGPLRWNRAKSGDELDALSRHLIDEDWAEVAWRAMANLQKQEEKRLGIDPPGDD